MVIGSSGLGMVQGFSIRGLVLFESVFLVLVWFSLLMVQMLFVIMVVVGCCCLFSGNDKILMCLFLLWLGCVLLVLLLKNDEKWFDIWIVVLGLMVLENICIKLIWLMQGFDVVFIILVSNGVLLLQVSFVCGIFCGVKIFGSGCFIGDGNLWVVILSNFSVLILVLLYIGIIGKNEFWVMVFFRFWISIDLLIVLLLRQCFIKDLFLDFLMIFLIKVLCVFLICLVFDLVGVCVVCLLLVYLYSVCESNLIRLLLDGRQSGKILLLKVFCVVVSVFWQFVWVWFSLVMIIVWGMLIWLYFCYRDLVGLLMFLLVVIMNSV